MYVVIALAALAILAGVVVLAMGKGGELSEAHPDYPPPLLPADRRLVAMDAAMLRLPRGLWGYQVDCADEALRMFAYALSERDMRLADLERQVAELRQTATVPDRTLPEISWLTPPGAQTHTAPEVPAEQTTLELPEPESPAPVEAESTPAWALPQPPEPWWQSESVTRVPTEGSEKAAEDKAAEDKPENEGEKS